jgi:hypothetical protein
MKLPDDFEVSYAILELEAKIGVPANFFRNLNDTDDWSFVIKLHALFEAACTHLLLFHFKEPQLAEVFSRLELSNKSTGKVAFLEKLELIGKENRRFIATLSELRNSLVHDVRNAEFSLKAMVERLDAQALKNMAIAFSPHDTHVRKFPYDPEMKLGYNDERQKASSISAVMNRFNIDPQFHIWAGAYSVLVSIVDMYDYSDYKQWEKANSHIAEVEGNE